MSQSRDNPCAENDASGAGLGSCFQEVLFIFLAVTLVVLVLGAGVTGGGAAMSLDGAGCAISKRFPAEIQRWCGLISENANETGLPADLLAALIWQESGGDELAYSRSGAVGLMQIMPEDGIAAGFTCKGRPCFQDRPSIGELQDPAFNVRYGSRLLASLVKDNGGDLRAGLRAYGPIDMGYRYADIVLGLYQRYRQ